MSKYIDKAREIRNRTDVHYNCAQGVLGAFADALPLEEETLMAIGANFGSGMRMGSVCGAITGALMVLGLFGAGEGTDSSALLKKARANHAGMLNCKDLLRANREAGRPQKEHCDGMVYEMVELTEDLLRQRGLLEA